MANQSVQEGRDWFERKLRENASKKNVRIDDLSWKDVPYHDASDLAIRGSGNEKEVRIKDLNLVSNKPNSYLEQCIEEIIDSLS
jgi:hypothetical protein